MYKKAERFRKRAKKGPVIITGPLILSISVDAIQIFKGNFQSLTEILLRFA